MQNCRDVSLGIDRIDEEADKYGCRLTKCCHWRKSAVFSGDERGSVNLRENYFVEVEMM